ncbi:LIPASE [Salix koriyanagi]|uniref:Lipase n=1 Tax=Salix koriyanagi TaxID=2511006 RepID=A0A9Q0Z748_9ROSI|nr:LIPASE [Salix koriyanagi]
MAEALATQILAILFCLSAAAAAARTKFYSFNSQDSTSVSFLNANDGICKLVVEPKGYACQEHTVTTKDGYILSIQRVPSGLSGQAADKPPVLLQHGLLLDGVTWLMNLPEQSLAFILADNGYDVWIANSRGTRFSRGHTSLKPIESVYWDWTWDELVAYDLSATFQLVHGQTGQNLHYVGHSLGTLIALAAFSQEKLLNMLRSAALLSPIAYLNHLSSPLARGIIDLFLAEDLYWLGVHEFAPRGGQAVNKLLEDFCSKPGINCSDIVTPITGPNCCLNSSVTNEFLDYEPHSTATKNLIHLAQMARTGTIAMYDYGNENMDHYGQPTPPVYNMASIPNGLPLFLSYGGKDYLSDVKDVQALLENLKDHDGDKLVVQYIDEYAHADFVLGVNANRIVFDPLMAFFKIN